MLSAALFLYDLCLSYRYQKMDWRRNLPQKEARFLVPNCRDRGTVLRAEGGHPKPMGADRVAPEAIQPVALISVCLAAPPEPCLPLPLPWVLWWGVWEPLWLGSKEHFNQRLDENSVMVDRSAFILCVCFLQEGIVIISTSMVIHGVVTLLDEALLRRLKTDDYKNIFYCDMNLTYFY